MKWLACLMCCLLLCVPAAYGEDDLDSMTNEELMQLINRAYAKLSMNAETDESNTILDADGVKIVMIGSKCTEESVAANVMVINDSDMEMKVEYRGYVVNGWSIPSVTTYRYDPFTRTKGQAVGVSGLKQKTDIVSVEDIETVTVKYRVTQYGEGDMQIIHRVTVDCVHEVGEGLRIVDVRTERFVYE